MTFGTIGGGAFRIVNIARINVLQAFRKGDMRALLESPELLSVVTDPELMEKALTVATAPVAGSLTETK